ncbi:MAG: D-alanyl-D-alanine carboxypeptidase/D-alanyl-D-alanine-endopeptidase [Alphaproteobacteria bacterium]|nr:D-alanyl-D-alanine carboxypeptidase/D-alanyl-D-alanine-endopeptidase [Alphaproteobacteria bacterium]MCB9697781.1 D-alanyl-D-alanine carboxypeptidase/D-alanyl-D-alanine-endopeptidase [Alphaproteobacteria bacterium]
MHLLALALLLLPTSFAGDRPTPPEPTQAHDVVAVPAPPAPSLVDELRSFESSWVFKKATSGLHVVDLQSGEEVYGVGADALLVPASTMKVLTAATALHFLGPSFRFTTDVRKTGKVDAAGTLHGDLYVIGHGDPTFVVEKMWKMVVDLRLAGITRIEGSVYFDDTYHPDSPVLPGWNKPEDDDRGTPYFSTLGALTLNSNTTVLVIGPGAEVGSKASVQLETPTHGYVEVDSEVSTVSASGRKDIRVERKVTADSTSFEVTGTWPIDETDRMTVRRTVADPTAHFLAAFRAMAESQGIAVTGRWERGKAPSSAEAVLSVESAPLSSVLADMNKSSLNLFAEQVLRTVGAEVTGQGTTQGGIEAVHQYLETLGIGADEAVLVNGSGLSRDARVAPSVLTAVLVDMAKDPKVSPEFQASLAIAGTDGTLWARLRDQPGRMRGKTGTLDNVICLTGYLDADNGRRYAFAWLVNDTGGRQQATRDVHDQFARRVFAIDGGGAASP